MTIELPWLSVCRWGLHLCPTGTGLKLPWFPGCRDNWVLGVGDIARPGPIGGLPGFLRAPSPGTPGEEEAVRTMRIAHIGCSAKGFCLG